MTTAHHKKMGVWFKNQYRSGFVYCDLIAIKIRGAYSEEQFNDAVYDYLMENERWTIGKLLRRKDPTTGKPLHTYETAYKEEFARLKRRYFEGKDIPPKDPYREPSLTVACAAQGQGKTYTTLNIIYSYVKGNKLTNTESRKVLILDANNEYRQFKTIMPEHVKVFSAHPKIEVRRVIPFHTNGEIKDLEEVHKDLKIMLKDFRGGLLVVEDTSLLLGDSVRIEMMGKFWTTRHRNADIILHFQALGKAGNPKLLSSTTLIRVHKTMDDIDRHENKFEDKYEIVKIAYNIVNQDYERATLEGQPR